MEVFMKILMKKIAYLGFILMIHAPFLHGMIDSLSTGFAQIQTNSTLNNLTTPVFCVPQANLTPQNCNSLEKQDQFSTAPNFNAYNNVISRITKPFTTLLQKTANFINPLTNEILPVEKFAQSGMYNHVCKAVAWPFNALDRFFEPEQCVLSEAPKRTIQEQIPEQDAQPKRPVPDVQINLNGGTKLGCTLVKDFTLTCCPEDTTLPCTSFNILDNDDPLHNCCVANDLGVQCSKELCDQDNAQHGPCTDSQKKLNMPIKFSQNNQAILEEIKKHEEIQDFPSNSEYFIEYLNAPNLEHFIEHIQNNFNINSNYSVKKGVHITDSSAEYRPNAQISRLRSLQKNMDHLGKTELSIASTFLYLSRFFPLDVVLGHEMAHGLQFQQQCNPISDACNRSIPGSEIDADILGALATLDTNAQSIEHLAIWIINTMKMNLNELKHAQTIPELFCSEILPKIDQSNVGSYDNLLESDQSKPHPTHAVRIAMLLKLNTMINAYLKHIAPTHSKQSEALTISTDESFLNKITELAEEAVISSTEQYKTLHLEKTINLLKEAFINPNETNLKVVLGAFQIIKYHFLKKLDKEEIIHLYHGISNLKKLYLNQNNSSGNLLDAPLMMLMKNIIEN